MVEQIKKILPQEEETANSVPAAAVLQRSQALFGITGRKACVGGFVIRVVKAGAQPADGT